MTLTVRSIFSEIFGDGSLELMEDRECERCVEHYSGESWNNTRIKAESTTGSHDSVSNFHEGFTTSIFLLHLSLDHIDGVVCHHRYETCKSTSAKVDRSFLICVAGEELLGISEDDKADTLVG